MDEQGRRRFAAAEARTCGFGGGSVVVRITGLVRSTIARGIEEIEQKPEVETTRVRKPGGGRKRKHIAENKGRVSAGTDHDTAGFAVEAIRLPDSNRCPAASRPRMAEPQHHHAVHGHRE